MAQDKKQWHPKFLSYMEEIINHPNYRGLPIKKNPGSYGWIATAKSKIGEGRKNWCINKAHELGFIDGYEDYPGMYADVMLKIHPTGWKVCQICGREMSLYYHYPNASFLKAIKKEFDVDFTDCDHISDLWDACLEQGIRQKTLALFFIRKGGLNLDPETAGKEEIIQALEYACRKGNKTCLGPGAMSNFPDRYDGFHTYNRCCRSSQDKGRSKENMRSYGKDRRAYEYWSDGNIHAANQFMHSSFFDGTTADHIGPISLGFVHDPHYLQPMPRGDNSSKRDRLLIEDIEHIMETEKRTGIYPMSWQSKHIWEYIKEHYRYHPEKVSTIYRDGLKQNMANFMYILYQILEQCPMHGEPFLVRAFLEPNYHYFQYSYRFNNKGEIIHKTPRRYTDRSLNEMDRYKRIAMEAVYDYHEKDNRNVKNNLSSLELNALSALCQNIESSFDISALSANKKDVVSLVEQVENRIIRSF